MLISQKFKNIENAEIPKNLRTFEAQPIFTGSYIKKECIPYCPVL